MNFLSRIITAHNFSSGRNLIRITSSCNFYSTDRRWKMAVKNAEKTVGYPTSFMNLRWLLNDEISNIASYLPKLIWTKHPMLLVAKYGKMKIN